MKGIIYTRVSSDEQVDGTSLASQEELCRKFCEQKSITVVGLFREEGESAKDLSLNNRSQFLAALEFCRREKNIEAFVVYRVDRFARNTEDHFSVRRVLMDYGTTLYSVTEPIGNKPAEKFIETVLAGAAEYDNAIRKQRCTDGLVARINQGIWPFKAPVGYACAHHRMKGEKKTVPDEPHPVLFPLIQRALRAYASGELISQAAVSRQLNAWGFAEAYGRPARAQTVDYMFGRYLRFYSGILVNPWTGKETTGLHEPMIDKTEAEQIRRRRLGLAPHAPAKRTAFNPAFPLRRLVRCAACGNFLTGTECRGHGGVYAYYYCFNKSCPRRSKGFARPRLHLTFAQHLRRLSPAPGLVAAFQRRLLRLLQERRGDEIESEKVQTRLRDLAARRRRICDMREDGTYDAATFKERITEVDTELASLTAPATGPVLSDLDQSEVLLSATWLATNLALLWQKLTLTSRVRFERLLFPHGIRYDPEQAFRTTKPGLILALLGVATNHSSDEVHLEGISSNQLYEYFEELVTFYHEMKEVSVKQTD